MIKALLALFGFTPIKIGDRFVRDEKIYWYSKDDIYEVIDKQGKYYRLQYGPIKVERTRLEILAYLTKIN